MEISQLNLWEVTDLFDYWGDHPPTHVLVGAYVFGAGRHRTARKPARGASRFNELMQFVTASGGGVHKRLPEIYRSGKESRLSAFDSNGSVKREK